MDSNRYKDWFEKAEKDFDGANILFKYEGDTSIVAFLCQQAIEKMFKGLILQKTYKLQNGHSLLFLCKNISQFDSTFRQYLKDCAFVNQFYIETRYPADVPLELSKEDAIECLDIATHLKKVVLQKSNTLEITDEQEDEFEM